jgi:hypothetical protein
MPSFLFPSKFSSQNLSLTKWGKWSGNKPRRSENICSNNGGVQENGKTGWNSGYAAKLMKKLVWVSVISFRKIFIPN